VDIKIKKLLEKNNIKHKLVEHRKVYTAFTEAETQHIDPKTVVKTVFLALSKPSVHVLENNAISKLDTVLVAVPAKNRIDLKKVAKAINTHQEKSHKILKREDPKIKKPNVITAKMAKEKDIIKKLKTKIGLLHPFGEVFGLPVLVDKKLLKNKKITVSAGSYTQSIELAVKDYLKITSHLQGNFTE
jgi:Ala-tRNA(Pro) deacylase